MSAQPSSNGAQQAQQQGRQSQSHITHTTPVKRSNRGSGSGASLVDFVWRSPAPKQEDVELAQVDKGSGFADPFDELASAHPPQPTCLAPELQGLQGAASGEVGDPLGASSAGRATGSDGARTSHTHGDGMRQPHASTTMQQEDLWPWAAFDEPPPPPASASARSSQGGHHHHHQQQQQNHQHQDRQQHQQGPERGARSPPRRSLASTSEGWLHGSEGILDGSSSSSSRPAGAAAAGGGGRGANIPASHAMQRTCSAGHLATEEEGHTSSMHGLRDDPQASGRDTGIKDTGEALLTRRSQEGMPENVRELYIYAIPLTKERLVFLPVAGWTEDPKKEPEGLRGTLVNGVSGLKQRVADYWQRMGNQDPNSFQHKMYTHGQSVLENMSAEERLMRNIPKTATKVVVYHPASVMPSEVQEQLTTMTSTYCLRSKGKAAAAGLFLPVAVGIECIAIPGAGWFTLYQLYKASVGSKGGHRLRGYLNHDDNVRVCYAGDERLNKYVERLKTCPDGILTQDDVDDLVHELNEPELSHPLSELRNRYLKRVRHKGEGDYALLPANVEDEDDEDGMQQPQPPPQKRGWLW